MLDQRRRRWADGVQMLDKCFVFTGYLFSEYEAIRKNFRAINLIVVINNPWKLSYEYLREYFSNRVIHLIKKRTWDI